MQVEKLQLPPPQNYIQLKTLFKSATVLEGPMRLFWEQWISVFEQFELDTTLSKKDLIDVVLGIQGQGLDSPMSIAVLNLPDGGKYFRELSFDPPNSTDLAGREIGLGRSIGRRSSRIRMGLARCREIY